MQLVLPYLTLRPASPARPALCSFQRYRLDSIRTGIMAGSPCPVEVMRRVQRDMHMTDVTICYGATLLGLGL